MTRTESDLEAALSEVDAPLDTEQLLAAVHRGGAVRRRWRVAGTVATAAAVLAAVGVPLVLTRDRAEAPAVGESPAPSGAPSAYACVASALPLPADIARLDQNIVNNIMVSPTGLDPSGTFIVGSYSGRDAAFVIRWRDGQPSRIPVNAPQVIGNAVNARGVVVGTGVHEPLSLESQTVSGFAWAYDGTLTELPTPAGFVAAQAKAINDRGEIAGVALREDGTRVAIVWSASHQVRILTAPGNASAEAITDDGIVVGSADGVQQTEIEAIHGRPYTWDSAGVGRFLDMPAGQDFGLAIAARGDWAVGSASHMTTLTVNGHTKGVQSGVGLRWNLGSGEMSTVDNWQDFVYLGVNARGDVASAGPAGATIVQSGWSYTLPGLADEDGSGGNVVMLLPAALSDDATVIVGKHTGKPGRPLVVWHC